jgi:predicted Zn-dependent protease
MRRLTTCTVILAAVACAQVKPPKPGFNLFSKQQDIELGQEAAAQVEKKYAVIRDPELQEYISGLGAKLARSRYASDFPYSFKVVADDSVNAFALPGGPMFIQTGLIQEVESEAQLAGVMAHEMSHIALRHGTNQASKANLVQLPLALASGGGGLLGSVVQSSVLLKFSRGAEAQADYNGVLIMSDAGYNPIELARFFEKLEAQKGKESRLGEFLSSHPNSGNRVQAIEALIRQLPPQQYSEGDIQGFRRAHAIVMKLPLRK